MAFFKKRASVGEEAAGGGGDSAMFGITLGQLKELMALRDKEFVEKLNSSDYNGVQGILKKLKVDRNTGLHSNDQQDLEQRRTAYGQNTTPRKPQSFLSFFTSSTEWQFQRHFRRTQDESDNRPISVIRDNFIQEIRVRELVVGDLCVVKCGDYFPVDGLVVEGNDLKVDESSMTGEADAAKKSENDDAILFQGTQVTEGSVRMVVTAVGVHTQVEAICDLLRNTKFEPDDNKEEEKK